MMRLSPAEIVGLTIYGESRGEPIEGQVAVGCVIRNRLTSGRWGATWESVCRAPKQFSCWNAADPNQSTLLALAASMMRGERVTDETLLQCLWVAEGITRGVIQPRVGRATHYHATTMRTAPSWAALGRLVDTVGHHAFFSGVR